jgi:hypothetical protein
MSAIEKLTESYTRALEVCDAHNRELCLIVLSSDPLDAIRDSILKYNARIRCSFPTPDDLDDEFIRKFMVVTKHYAPLFNKHDDKVERIACILRDETSLAPKKINLIKNILM